MENNKPILITISAPSGCGKDAIIEEVCKRLPHVGLSVSCTTRERRFDKKKNRWEQEGVDYFFIGQEEFDEKIRQNEFLEYARFTKNWYGTPRAYVEELHARGNDVVILNIENQGAMQIKAMDPTAVSIFILPPSARELRRRLIERAAETLEEIENRMVKNAEQLRMAYAFDYIVMNDVKEEAIEDVVHIIAAERRKAYLHKRLIDQVNATFG